MLAEDILNIKLATEKAVWICFEVLLHCVEGEKASENLYLGFLYAVFFFKKIIWVTFYQVEFQDICCDSFLFVLQTVLLTENIGMFSQVFKSKIY